MNEEEINLLENVVLNSDERKTFKKSELKTFLEQNSPVEILKLIAVCLNNFVRSNFVGPPFTGNENKTPILAEFVSLDEEFEVDGLTPYNLVKNVEFLTLSKWISIDFYDLLLREKKCPSIDLWALRCLFLWQKILPEKSATLKIEAIKKCRNLEMLLKNLPEKFSSIISSIYVEIGYVYLFYYEYKSAEEVLTAAADVSKLNIRLTGILGRKTKFQQFDVAQLVVEIETKAEGRNKNSSKDEVVSSVPVDCRLNDDTLFEKTQLTTSVLKEKNLTDEEQLILLAVRKLALEGKAADELSDEESSAYLDALLDQPRRQWTVQTSALYARSKREMNSRRKIDRCLSQLEELVQQFNHSDDKISLENRLQFAFAVDSTPIWEVERTLADVLVRLGAVRPALDVYCRLEMWTEAIQCYKQLNLLDRAERLIRDRLAERETPQMLCLLGDITLQEEYYRKAWTLSNGRYAEAQKRLGFHYFRGKFYDKAVEAFQLAVKLQPLQTDTWFTLGYCAVQVNRHDVAAEAYRRCVGIEPDNFEAWNNLAAAYVSLNRKEHAYQILQEAVKYSFDNWKIWDNIVVIAVDIGRFDDAVRGLHRLLDLKEKYYDVRVLTALVAALTDANVKDAYGQPTGRLKPDLKRFFGRLTSVVASDPNVWRLYADLSGENLEENNEEWDKYFRLLQKAHNCACQKSGWEKNLDECRRVLNYAAKMAAAGTKLIQLMKNQESSINQIKSSVRLSLKSAIGTVEKFYGVNESLSLLEEVKNLHAVLINFN